MSRLVHLVRLGAWRAVSELQGVVGWGYFDSIDNLESRLWSASHPTGAK